MDPAQAWAPVGRKIRSQLRKGLLCASLGSGVLSSSAVLSAQTQPAAPVEAEARQAPHASLVVTRGDGAEDCPDAATLAEQVHRVSGANVVGAE